MVAFHSDKVVEVVRFYHPVLDIFFGQSTKKSLVQFLYTITKSIKEENAMSQGYEYVKNSRHNLKRRLLYVMGDKCCICGYDKCPSALEFHHTNPEEKDFSISSNANIAFNKAVEEVKKCILVCANCHREIHAGLIKDIEEYKSFDEQKCQEINQELIDLKQQKIHYCINCGKIISNKAERCPECARIERRKVDRPDREKLKELIRTLPFTHIATQYGVTDKAISKQCIAANLPSRKRDINAISDEDQQKI